MTTHGRELLGHMIQGVVLAIVIITILLYFNFTAEDAYITYRYAENLVSSRSLVYNLGEPINAMTSPLHAFLSAILFSATGRIVISNKLLALLLLTVSATLVWRRYRTQPQLQPLVLVLMLLPPSVMLWTVGGLETPLLYFFVALSLWLAFGVAPFTLKRLCALALTASLAFLTRYDSILFFMPLMAYGIRRGRALRHVAIALLLFSALPLLWLAASIRYYGDPLPTSFYVKTPEGGIKHLLYNGTYITSYLLVTGIIPVLTFALVWLSEKRHAPRLLLIHVRAMWWLYLGVLLQLLYGLTMATHHMMFSFRFFIPYVPAAVIISVDLLRYISEAKGPDTSQRRSAMPIALFSLGLALFQSYQIVYTYERSVNGIVSIGEYQSLGVRDYVRFMEILRQEGVEAQRHWHETRIAVQQRPRILTYAAGILPYTFRESYIYEQLVSYRHCYKRHDQALYADYVHLMAPRHGSVDQQLPLPENAYELVSSHEMTFDGAPQQFLVFYNPQPQPHNLGARIDAMCQPAK